QRIAAPEAGQAGVDDPPAKLFGEAGAFTPVHAASGEVAVDIDGPDRRGAGTIGPVGVHIVRDGELQQASLDAERTRHHADRRCLSHLALVLIPDHAETERWAARIGQFHRREAVRRRHDGARNLQPVHCLGHRLASWKTQSHSGYLGHTSSLAPKSCSAGKKSASGTPPYPTPDVGHPPRRACTEATRLRRWSNER